MKKTICFDIDNTICKTVKSDYKRSKPIIKNIKYINNLYDKGHVIKIFTDLVGSWILVASWNVSWRVRGIALLCDLEKCPIF